MTFQKPPNRMATESHRFYRNRVTSDLVPVHVAVQETDLTLYAKNDVAAAAKEAVIIQRGYLERYISGHPGFLESLDPWPQDDLAPVIVQKMIAAGQRTQVGPMAAVAGAVAEAVGQTLFQISGDIIVENGGDIYINCQRDTTVAVYANQSPLSLKVGLHFGAARMPLAVCTSSGTVGHSFSKGKSDAVCVVSPSCPLADAAATAVANRVIRPDDIQPAIEWGRRIQGLDGGIVIIGDRMGVWGKIEIVPV